jgi:hypothetical protein
MVCPYFPGVIDDALRYRFLRHHMYADRTCELFARAATQDEFQQLLDRWINEDWNKKHAALEHQLSSRAALSVFRRDLLRPVA